MIETLNLKERMPGLAASREPVERVLTQGGCKLTIASTTQGTAQGIGGDKNARRTVPIDAVLELLREAGGSTVVWCTHGDIVPAVLDAVREQDGVELADDHQYPKGSVWELDQDETGRVTKATYLPAPSPD